jgi:hypothetical protein
MPFLGSILTEKRGPALNFESRSSHTIAALAIQYLPFSSSLWRPRILRNQRLSPFLAFYFSFDAIFLFFLIMSEEITPSHFLAFPVFRICPMRPPVLIFFTCPLAKRRITSGYQRFRGCSYVRIHHFGTRRERETLGSASSVMRTHKASRDECGVR